ncbi:MAG: EAL domain-containing protein, partial [Candidatus Phosphoribacter sp.]
DCEPIRATLTAEFPNAQVWSEPDLKAARVYLAAHHVDAVLTNMSLPHALGVPVLGAVRAANPETVLMAVTGGADSPLSLWVLAGGEQAQPAGEEQDGAGLAAALLWALQRGHVEKEAEGYLQLARGLLDSLEEPTCVVDSGGRIVAVNQAWRDFGVANGGTDEGCGVGVSYLETCDHAAKDRMHSGARSAAIVAEGIRHVLAGSLDDFSHDYPCHSPSESRWFSVRLTPSVINGVTGAVISHRSIAAMHEVRRSVAPRSLHDQLTGLPNRLLMFDRIEQAVGEADRRGVGIAVTRLDLHRYQQVIDSLGYRGGDALLGQVAERLQEQLGPRDTLCRSSADAFLVLWHDLDRPDSAVELTERLVRSLEPPFVVADVPVPISACAGVAIHSRGHSVDALLRSTDAALQDAESRGPGHVVLFTEEQRAVTTFRRSLEADLRVGLQGTVTQFVVHYQPLVDLASGQVMGVESLVRWQHPAWGLLGPNRFIPLAEATGLIGQLGDWVFEQAIRDTATLTHRGRELDVAVNFSVHQLDHDAVAKVQRALNSGGLRPDRLTLEVSESAFIEDEEATAGTLAALSRLGVKIAMDDFGTGYNSLLYLHKYPAHTLKLDRTFVAGIGESADDEAICASIISLAAAVGAATVGEGVETMEQYAFLRSLGCQQGQGFLWSPAVPIDKLGAALAACDEVPLAAPRSSVGRPSTAQDSQVAALISKLSAERTPFPAIARTLNRTVGGRNGLPWTAASVARRLPAAGPQAGSDTGGSAPLVLVCADAEPIRRTLTADLEMAGFEVDGVPDGHAAMSRLIDPEARAISVIVMVNEVPPDDTQWLISAINGHSRLNDVPVLLVADAATAPGLEVKDVRFDEIVFAPFGASEIADTVARLAGTGRIMQRR